MRGGQPGAFGKGGHNPWQRGSYGRPSYPGSQTSGPRQQQYQSLEVGQKITVTNTEDSSKGDSLTTVVGRTLDGRSVRIFIDKSAGMQAGWHGEIEIYRASGTPGIYSGRAVAKTAQNTPSSQTAQPYHTQSQPSQPRSADTGKTLDVTVEQPSSRSSSQPQRKTIAFSDLTGTTQDSALIYVPPQALEMLAIAGFNYVIMQGQAVDGNAARIQTALQTHVRSGKPLYQIDAKSPDMNLTLGQYLAKYQQGMEVDVGEKTLEAPPASGTAQPTKSDDKPGNKPSAPADVEVFPKGAPIPPPKRDPPRDSPRIHQPTREIVRSAPAVRVSSRPGGGSGYSLENLLR